MTPHQTFVERCRESLAAETFVRLTLGGLTEPELERVIGRLIELRGAPHLSLTFRYPTRDVTKNLPVPEVAAWLLEQKFRNGLLATTTGDWQFTPQRLIRHKPATSVVPPRQHDRAKSTRLGPTAQPWLAALGIVNPDGSVRPSMAAKHAQIDRYLEIVGPLLPETGTILDMGAGKGYLTFALWHWLRDKPVQIIGVEQRQELVNAANEIARQVNATGLKFLAGTIESVELPGADALIALHACNTATDAAIRRGVALGAKLIVVAPCCHQELRPQLGRPDPLGAVLAHGLMAERMAEWVTDGLRLLALEWAGYRTKAIEFVGGEHTPKNLMIAAVRDPARSAFAPAGREQLERLKKFYGIEQWALDELGRD